MILCLKDNKVCSNTNRRCKECVLDECKEVIKMIEEEQKYEYLDKLAKLNKELPEQCRNCSFLEVINLDKKIVYCPYMIKDRCLIN